MLLRSADTGSLRHVLFASSVPVRGLVQLRLTFVLKRNSRPVLGATKAGKPERLGGRPFRRGRKTQRRRTTATRGNSRAL